MDKSVLPEKFRGLCLCGGEFECGDPEEQRAGVILIELKLAKGTTPANLPPLALTSVLFLGCESLCIDALPGCSGIFGMLVYFRNSSDIWYLRTRTSRLGVLATAPRLLKLSSEVTLQPDGRRLGGGRVSEGQ